MEAKWIDKETFPAHQDAIARLVRNVYPEQRPNNVLPFGAEAMRNLLDDNGRICALYQEDKLLAYFYLSQARKLISDIVRRCLSITLEAAPSETGRCSEYALIGGFLLRKDLGPEIRKQFPRAVHSAVANVLSEDPAFGGVNKVIIKITNEERGADYFLENPFMQRFLRALSQNSGQPLEELETIQRGSGLPFETVYLARLEKAKMPRYIGKSSHPSHYN